MPIVNGVHVEKSSRFCSCGNTQFIMPEKCSCWLASDLEAAHERIAELEAALAKTSVVVEGVLSNAHNKEEKGHDR